MDLATGEETQLVAGDNPAISPDGSFVLYSLFEGEHGSIHKISIAGGAAQTVCQDCASQGIKGFSSDGSRVLAQNWSEKLQLDKIELIHISSGEVKEVLGDPKHSLWHPYFSWDDKWMTFSMQLDPHGLNALTGPHRIYITPVEDSLPAGDSRWIALTSGEYWDDKPQLSPDGNTLYFSSNRDGNICFMAQRLNPKTKHPVGEPFPIQHFHNQQHIPWAASPMIRMELCVARDKIVTALDEFHSSIWMMQLEPVKGTN